jgi:energy-coupling factor transporter ATP-binding protein EcfA2
MHSGSINLMLVNPYQQIPPPFAGRKPALNRFRQALAERRALLYLGRQGIGKTALLRHLEATLDDSYLAVYLPLRDTPIADETDWVLSISQSITAEILKRDFTYSRLSQMPPPGDDPRGWFSETFLPEIIAIIRVHRRLILLLDDAEGLLDAMTAGALPADHPAFLLDVLMQHEQVALVLSLDSSRDADTPHLYPLIAPDDTVRLTNLTEEDCRALLQEPTAPHVVVADAAAARIYEATGGTPLLVLMYGDALFQHWEAAPTEKLITVEVVRQVTTPVYRAASAEFRRRWDALTLNERLVLTAMSSLLYADPQTDLTTDSIEAWLVETDYPMDATTINAALRSLQYDELVGAQPLTIPIGLLHTWLLENARLTDLTTRRTPPLLARHWWLLVALVVVLLVGVVLLTRLNSQPPPVPNPAPTVTLVEPTAAR